MKNLLFAVALFSAGSAFAQGWRGGHHNGGHHGGHHGGGYHSARPVYVRPPPPVYVAPRPVYVRPRPVYVAPPPRRVYAAPPRPVYVGPRYGYAPAPGISFRLPLGAISLSIGSAPYFLSGGTFYLQTAQGYSVVEPPLGAAVSVLPPDAVRQDINGYAYATSNGAWFVWDGNRGAWVVVERPY